MHTALKTTNKKKAKKICILTKKEIYEVLGDTEGHIKTERRRSIIKHPCLF